MGNRAVITTKDKKIGIYLHWNGGRDSVEAFLEYCRLQNFRCPEVDNYGWARFCQIVSNFFGGTSSIGVGRYDELYRDNGDNGVYIIENWHIVGREFFNGFEQNEYKLPEMLKAIDECQPSHMQLGEDFLKAEIVKTAELKIGDVVFIEDFEGYKKFTVVGFGKNEKVNGLNVEGLPFVNQYGENNDYSKNINNYIQENEIRRVKNETNYIKWQMGV